VAVSSNTPYPSTPVGVAMTVTPPASWGKIAGTVTDGLTGSPVPGAVVQINTLGGTGSVTYTLKTDASGHYQLWLDAKYTPLQVIASKDGYQPQTQTVKIKRGKTITANFTLPRA